MAKYAVFELKVKDGEDKSRFSAGKKIFLQVKTPEKLFTIFTGVSIRRSSATQPPILGRKLRIDSEK